MRIISLTASAIVALGVLGASSAFAADWSATTCGDFTAMTPAAQTDLVSQISRADVAKTEANSNSSGMTQKAGGQMASAGGSTAAPLTAGAVVAACQAATMSTTLGTLAGTPGAFGLVKANK